MRARSPALRYLLLAISMVMVPFAVIAWWDSMSSGVGWSQAIVLTAGAVAGTWTSFHYDKVLLASPRERRELVRHQNRGFGPVIRVVLFVVGVAFLTEGVPPCWRAVTGGGHPVSFFQHLVSVVVGLIFTLSAIFARRPRERSA